MNHFQFLVVLLLTRLSVFLPLPLSFFESCVLGKQPLYLVLVEVRALVPFFLLLSFLLVFKARHLYGLVFLLKLSYHQEFSRIVDTIVVFKVLLVTVTLFDIFILVLL